MIVSDRASRVVLKRRTTIIVGAGCSAEYGLPVGDGLKDVIADSLYEIGKPGPAGKEAQRSSAKADPILAKAVQEWGYECGSTKYEAVAHHMSGGIRHASSIDRYLNLHRDNEPAVQIGKLAISRAILAAEQRSSIGEDALDLTLIKQRNHNAPHWLHELFLRLQDDVPLTQIERIFSNLTIITFNYDRVIEHYLFHALQALGNLDKGEAARAMSHLNIVHPYGKIGRLPWQPEDGSPDLPFGYHRALAPHMLIASAQRLRTFTETVDDDEVISKIHAGILTAEQIIFLGFSFLPQNLELMRSESESGAQVVLATSFRESASNIRIAKDNIVRMLRGHTPPQYGSVHPVFSDTASGPFLRENGNEIAS